MGKTAKLAKGKTTSVELKVYTRKERLALTRTAARVLHQVLKTSGGGKIVKRSLKAHDPKSRITNLERYMTSGMKKTFPPIYRDIWPSQDEFVRTSFVTDLLVYLLQRNLTQSELDELKTAVEGFSNLRFPTRWSGFKFKPGFHIGGHTEMQHPTSAGTGIWIPSKSVFSIAHTNLDEARARTVIDAILDFIQKDVNGVMTLKPNANLESVVKAALVAAGTFTMRSFTAPALAGNVDATASMAVKIAQTQAREFMKDQLESLGAKRYVPPLGVVIPNLNLPERPFTPDILQPGQISPRRGPMVSPVEAERLWAA